MYTCIIYIIIHMYGVIFVYVDYYIYICNIIFDIMKDRILQLIESLNLSAQRFSELTQIDRSSLSHIKTGRTKPSIEVAIKILDAFPNVSSDWLLMNKGNMFNGTPNDVEKQPTSLFDLSEEKSSSVVLATNKSVDSENQINTSQLLQEIKTMVAPLKTQETRRVERIMVYYSDNTFEEFKS